jgi:hypothetical protein
MPRSRLTTILLLLLTTVLRPARIQAQDQGVAVITSPLEGAIASGVVPIGGTATHPQFQRYELAFGYSPNPTDTWFSIQEPSTSQVVNDILGRWDTTGIADGNYVLRLRVYWTDRAFLEAFVQNVRIENATPTPIAAEEAIETPLPLPSPEPTTPAGTPEATPIIVLPATSTPRPTANAAIIIGGDSGAADTIPRLNSHTLGNAFLEGVRLTLIIFLLLGGYAGLRAALRSRPRR